MRNIIINCAAVMFTSTHEPAYTHTVRTHIHTCMHPHTSFTQSHKERALNTPRIHLNPMAMGTPFDPKAVQAHKLHARIAGQEERVGVAPEDGALVATVDMTFQLSKLL